MLPASTTATTKPSRPPIYWRIRQANLSCRELADALGYHHVHIIQVVNGARRASPDLQAKIAAHLGIPEDELFGDGGP